MNYCGLQQDEHGNMHTSDEKGNLILQETKMQRLHTKYIIEYESPYKHKILIRETREIVGIFLTLDALWEMYSRLPYLEFK